MKILVVDDEKLLVKGVKFNLENEGYEVTAAYDGAAAVELAKKENFDLIVMDVMMPEINGLEATRAIRAHSRPDAASIPIVAMTADAFSEDVRHALDAGMNAHIAKPVDIEKLIQTILRFLPQTTGA